MLTKEQLLKDGFALEQYPDGKFWVRRVHDELFIQVDEAITEVSLYQNGWVDNGLSLAEYHSAVHQLSVQCNGEFVMLDPQDIRVTSYLPQSGHGAGGMTVGLTTSGIIVHHMPSGLGVSCDSERSQHANKEKALKMLALIVEQQTPQMDEFARLMAQATALCPELIPTPVLMNTPVSASNRTMGHKVNMIKEVREKAGCGLKEAKEAVDEVYGYSVDFDDVITKATLWAMSR